MTKLANSSPASITSSKTLGNREKALQESEAFKNTILNSMAAEIVVLDQHGVIQAVNKRWRRFSRENSSQPGQPAAHTEAGVNYLDFCTLDAAALADDAANPGAESRRFWNAACPPSVSNTPATRRKNCAGSR
jgi:hypothetical protein